MKMMVLQSNVKNSLGILAVKRVTLVKIIVFDVLYLCRPR
jgi:hypothetical protein